MTNEQVTFLARAERASHDIAYLRDLLAMCERSPQYREGPHWAIATVSRLRADLKATEEYQEGVRRIRESVTA